MIFLIKSYQILFAAWVGPVCRFEPSCSNYWIEGIQKKGLWKGIFLGVSRILRCHPFHKGGWDPHD